MTLQPETTLAAGQMRLWGRLSSINVRKVMWVVQELGLHQHSGFARHEAGAHHGVTREAAYLAHNPNALVPLWQDEHITLWESNAIVRYLVARHGQAHTLRMPTDLVARFDAERWMDWQQTTLNPAGRDAFMCLVRRGPVPLDATHLARIGASIEATHKLWDMLNERLSRRAHIGGDAFGMADIPVACEMHRWQGLLAQADWRRSMQEAGWQHTSRPALDDWWQRMQARPAARGVLDLPLS
jgi:glutathione S-transferase